MEQVYKVGIFSKIFYGLCAGGMVVFFGFMILSHPQDNKAVYAISLFPIIICLLILVHLFKSKIIITNTTVTRERIFFNKQVAIADILGYRKSQKYILLETKSGDKLSIGNYIDFYRSEDLTKWVVSNFTDLDKIEYDIEEKKLLLDESIGSSETERRENIDKAKQIALAYNIWGFIMPFISIIAQGNVIASVIALSSPLIGILILTRRNHLIKFLGDSIRSARPSISFGLMFSVGLLFLTAVLNNHILSFNNLWPPALVITVLFFIALYFYGIDKSTDKLIQQILAMAVFSLVYGLGSSLVLNTVFDYSTPNKYKSSIIYAYAANGKGGTHFHFTIAAWPGQDNSQEEDIDRQQYLSIPVGSAVEVYQKKGLFNMPWYYVVLPVTTPPVPADSNNGNSPAPR